MKHYEVAIIGGGLAGCSAALHIAKRGVSVVLFERGRCGAQASGVNFGGVRQQGRHPAELPLARRSRGLWDQLPELVGSNCEFVPTGHLKLARTDAEMAELEAYRNMARDFGLELELVGKKRLHEMYPYLGDNLAGGSLCREDGQANPRLVAPAFSRAARRAGADIREMSPVAAATHTGQYFEIKVRDEVVSAAKLINVAGAWGAKVAAWFGDEVEEGVIAPNMCVTEPLPLFMGPNLGVCGGSIYLRQIPHGSVIFGAGMAIADPEKIRARPLAEVTQEGARLAIEMVPRLANALLVRTWTGIEGSIADGIPVFGPSLNVRNLFHAFGFTGHGFQLGPGAGAVLCELALDGETRTAIDGLSIERFQKVASSVGRH
ncbi:NAD(P)/FAD-dependent oxidoreductase [Sinorhizobium fredii]|uniref:NAD(P)/FAD-dependent oxidoreductase n=1 Tax=Rhizobium fredii TaxID=380 RepID=UPI0004BAB768|nr:FAD-binding oxidoreductase [Sinorhizobium fredii]ASY73839.1 Sarcosine oxidase beta subunit [Sinorhizobium fredii CCBAU 83666]